VSTTNYWHRFTSARVGRRRGLQAAALVGASAAFLAACGGDDEGTGTGGAGDSGSNGLVTRVTDSTKEAKRGGVLNWFSATESPSFDLATANLSNNDKIILAYNTLLQVKPGVMKASDREVGGDLAQSWEWSPDLLTLTMKIRPGITWHNKAPVNGRPFDTEDVNFSWDRVTRLSGDRSQIANVVNPNAPILSMTTPDSSTIVVKLKYPQSYLLGILARNFGAKVNMVPKETDTTFDIRRDMIGTGAYMLSKYEPSVGYEYKLHPGYYEPDHHYVDQINQPIIREYATGLAQFKAGNLHTWNVLPEDVLSVKAESPGINLYQGEFASNTLNTAFGYLPGSPFHDERVRQAWSMSVDRDLWIEVFYNVANFEKEGLPVDTRWNSALLMTEEGWWVDPKGSDIGEGGKYFQHNIEEAKKLLAAAGHANGFDVPVTLPVNASGYPTEFNAQAEVFDQMMRESGFRPQNQQIDYVAQFVPQYRDAQGKFDGLIYKVGTTVADDAVASLGSRFQSAAGAQFYGFDAGGKGDQSGDPQVDSLLAKAIGEIDTERRKGIVKDLERYLARKQYLTRWPGGATGFQMAWPTVQNFLVYRGSAAGTSVGSRLTPYYWWLDSSKT